MISNTEFSVTLQDLSEANKICQEMTGKTVLNKPTGDFFYDPWEILPEYSGTVFERLLQPLQNIGEARIIRQESGTCYFAHSDIDNRYHLNISGDQAALLDLHNNKMYPLEADGKYYLMDAGRNHSAANFGQFPRYQLVVRCLLKRSTWVNEPVEIIGAGENPRFVFDKYISPLLNEINRRGAMNKFCITTTGVKFITNDFWINELRQVMPDKFSLLTQYNLPDNHV